MFICGQQYILPSKIKKKSSYFADGYGDTRYSQNSISIANRSG